jgi:small-conductance mechanosensitive channel
VGYADFARVVGDGTLRSLYLFLVSYAGFRVGMTFLLVALSSERLAAVAIVGRHTSILLRWGKAAQVLALSGFWLAFTLEGFGLREQLGGWVTDRLTTSHELGSMSISILDLLLFPFTLFLAYTLSRVIRAVLEDEVYPRVRLERGVPNAISTAVHYLVLFLGFLFALGAAGIDFSRFSLLAGALGVGIGFGLQDVVNNFVSGLILLVERPIHVGDVIEVGDLRGRVVRIGIRACTVVTYRGAEVIVPNGNLLSNQLVNWTLSDKARRVELPVGVAYGNRPERVLELLKRVVEEADSILRYPAPTVLFRGFGDSSLDFEMRFWAPEDSYMQASSEIASKVYDALAEAEIEIPFPQRDLHLRSVAPAVADRIRGDRREDAGD